MSEINNLTVGIIEKVLDLQKKGKLETLVHISQDLEWVGENEN